MFPNTFRRILNNNLLLLIRLRWILCCSYGLECVLNESKPSEMIRFFSYPPILDISVGRLVRTGSSRLEDSPPPQKKTKGKKKMVLRSNSSPPALQKREKKKNKHRKIRFLRNVFSAIEPVNSATNWPFTLTIRSLKPNNQINTTSIFCSFLLVVSN